LVIIYSLTGGIGAAGVAVPATSVIGAPGAASLLPPTVAAVGSVPGAPVLPVTTQNVTMSTPTEFLLLKNMFDPALEVFLFCKCFRHAVGVTIFFVCLIQIYLAWHLYYLILITFVLMILDTTISHSSAAC
jgi:hypothetical protein